MSDHEYQVACIRHDIRALRATLKDARDEILSMRGRLARAEKVIQAARKLVDEVRYLTVEQCEREGLSAGTGNRLRDALAEYGEE